MNEGSNQSPRLFLLIAVLASALLACTLSFSRDSTSDETPDAEGEVAEGGPAPTVRVVEPQNGQQVPRNQPVDITVETDATATSFILNVNGRVASTKALPPGQSGPTTAILTWMPERDGSFSLEVIAFNGTNASTPATISVVVSGTAASPSAVGGLCTARVLVTELNFREGAGTSSRKLGQFEVGETVTVIGRNGDSSWYRVERANAQQVWVIRNNDWLRLEGDCDGVPVAE
jgi:hypothetical protein